MSYFSMFPLLYYDAKASGTNKVYTKKIGNMTNKYANHNGQRINEIIDNLQNLSNLRIHVVGDTIVGDAVGDAVVGYAVDEVVVGNTVVGNTDAVGDSTGAPACGFGRALGEKKADRALWRSEKQIPQCSAPL